jgi:spermidine synthase
MTWFEETLYRDVGQRFIVGQTIYREKTEHQDLVIFENPVMGRILALDGIIQTTERDEFIYHEMLTHVPILAHGSVKRVLIIGGGDGGMLEEVLKHPVEKCTMVEIDRAVVDLSIKYLPSICGKAFEDRRTELIITDGLKYAAETNDKFDIIIVDSTDPMGPGEVLFTTQFYTDCRRCLNPGGQLVTQNGVPFFQGDELRMTRGRLKPLFKDVACYVAAVPTYYGGFMAFGWGTDNAEARRQPVETIRKRFQAAKLDTRYYTPDLHVGAFALPKFIADLIA